MKGVLLSPQAVRVLDYLNSVNYIPTIAEIGSAVGLSTPTTWRILKELKSQGVVFKAVVDTARLGLTEVLLIYKTRVPLSRVPRKLLRSFLRTLEGITFLKYVTKAHEVESTVNYVISSIGLEPSEVYVMDAVVPPRYVLTHITRGTLDKLYLRELIAVTYIPLSPGRPCAVSRVDSIDIALVNRLEEDALVKIKEVYEAMKRGSRAPSYQTVLKHFREHILKREVIVGVRPTIENYVERVTASTKKLLVLYGTPNLLVKGVRAVIAIPAFTEAYINTKEGIAYTASVLPIGLTPKIVDFLGILESRGLIEEWVLLETEPASVLRLPIPEALGAMSVSELLAKTNTQSATQSQEQSRNLQ